LCGSGMDAIIIAARAIKAGEAELMISGGVESMSRAPFVMPKAETAFSRNAEIHDTTIGWRFVNPLMQEQYGIAVVSKDEHPRGGTTIETLAKLPTPFRQGGTVTAGNASGVNDGAAALIVASEAAVKKYGLTPIARILGGAVAGVVPRIMGIGPVPATQKLCARIGLKPADLDVIELNEAFASQAIAVLRQLGIA
ncbi:MAG: 3-oxoadipyl-CoA thiolase, partial [Mesorhizobium sp.]